MEFSDRFTRKFIEWQSKEGGRRTVTEFAEYLGVSQQTVSVWLNSRGRPGGKSIGLLAGKLGSEIYDILNMPHPAEDPQVEILKTVINNDPAIKEMINIISKLPEDKAKEFTEKIVKLAMEMAREEGGEKE